MPGPRSTLESLHATAAELHKNDVLTSMHRLSLFLCLSLAVLVPDQSAQAASSSWTPGSSLIGPRAASAASLLPDGRVLFTGGIDASGALATTEIFNGNGSFSGSAPMHDARASHTAVT